MVSTQAQVAALWPPDGTPYTVYPDVMVFPRPMDRDRGHYSLAADGPPVLVVEAASPHTVAVDLDLARGKAWSYRHAGMAEYLALDPTGLLVPGFGRGWRLGPTGPGSRRWTRAARRAGAAGR